MAGVIRADVRRKRCACGGAFKRVKDSEYIHDVPRCEECRKPPPRLMVRVTLPKIGKIDIRSNHQNKRLTTLSMADSFLNELHEKIGNRSFNPEDYGGKRIQSEFLVKNAVEKYLNRKEQFKGKRAGCSPSWLKDAWLLLRKEIEPEFGMMDIREIKHSQLDYFLESGNYNQRRKAIQIIRPVMKQMAKDYPSMVLPIFPTLRKVKTVERSKMIDRGQQIKILNHVQLFRDAIILSIIYPIRPCEVRALQWQDIDFKNRTLKIQRHFSSEVLLPGRKSNPDPSDPWHTLELRLVPEAFELFTAMVRPLDSNEWIFKNRRGKHLDPQALRKQWKKACDLVGIQGVTYYADTKHVTLDHYHNDLGIPLADLKAISGHTKAETVARYSPTKSLATTSRYEGLLGSKGRTKAPTGSGE